MEKYTKLTGEDATHVPIMKLGAYLDGYDKGIELIDKIRAEMDVARFIDKDTKICKNANASGLEVAMQIIEKYKAESENL